MTMTEELIGYDIHASFNGANQFQAANIERRYRVTTGDGTYERRARGVVADLASVVPSSDLMEQVTALTSQLAEANAAKASTEASVSSLTAQLAAAQTQIDTLTGVIDKGQPTKANLLRYVSQVRQQRAAAGVTVNGMPVSTDLESRDLLSGAVLLCQLDPTTVIDWHIPGNGSVQLTAEQVKGLSRAVGRYIQSGFATVAALTAGIAADPPSIVTFEQIDAATWPSTTLTA